MLNVMHFIKIHASCERVYQALTTAEGIRSWWIYDPELDSKIGRTDEFHFHYTDQRVARVRIHELKPPVRMGWMDGALLLPPGVEKMVPKDTEASSTVQLDRGLVPAVRPKNSRFVRPRTGIWVGERGNQHTWLAKCFSLATFRFE